MVSAENTMTKMCSKCGEQLPDDRKHYYCRDCMYEYNKAYREKRGEALKERERQWHRDNYDPDRKREYYRATREDRLKYSKDYYRRNTEKCLAATRQWSVENPVKHYASQGVQTAIRRSPVGRQVLPADFNISDTYPFYALSLKLRKETGAMYHVEHLVPLCSGLPDLHTPDNLFVVPAKWNVLKGRTLDRLWSQGPDSNWDANFERLLEEKLREDPQ